MTQIQISSEDVMAYSKQVDAYANEIRTVFNEIESKMVLCGIDLAVSCI